MPMPVDDPLLMSATEIAAAVGARRLSAVEVTRQRLERIARLDGALGCFLHVDAQGALLQAAAVDAAL